MDLREAVLKKISEIKKRYRSLHDEVIKDCIWAKEHDYQFDAGKLEARIREMNYLNRELDMLCILLASAD